MDKPRYTSIDCIKGLACIAVVFIHYNITGGSIHPYIGLGMKTVCRFGVPVFFCVSGFFLSSSKHIDANKIVKKTTRIIRMLFISGLFYLCFTYVWNPISNSSWNAAEQAASLLTATKLLKLIVTHDPLVYSHLWFMLALIFCYLFVLLFLNDRNRNIIYVMAPVCLITYSCMQEFHLIPMSFAVNGMESRIYIYNSFLFRGLPAFLFGMIMRDHQDKIVNLNISGKALLLLAFLGCCSSVIERKMLYEAQFYIGSYITWVSLMFWAIRNPNAKHPLLLHIGRDLSMYVYILHIAVGKTVDIIGGKLHFWGHDPYYIVRPFAVLLLSLLVSECVFRVVSFVKSQFNDNNPNSVQLEN